MVETFEKDQTDPPVGQGSISAQGQLLASASSGDCPSANFEQQKARSAEDDHDAGAPASPAEGDSVAKYVAKSGDALAQIFERLESLQRAFDTKIKYDAAKEKQLDTLHAELQSHREDLYSKIMRPLFMDLIEMYDDMHSLVRHGQAREDSTEGEARLQRSLASFLDTIVGILERYGVSVFSAEGDSVSPQRQRAIKLVDTQIPEQDRLIAERLRKGFSYDGKVLRPELVATYRLTRAANAANPEGS
jgi:molecular chaperone GrpE